MLTSAKNYMNACSKKIVKFNGGLGNQMFQYAFACALADKFNVDILFDFSYFEEVKRDNAVTSRVFELGVFNLDCKTVTQNDLQDIKKPDSNSKFKNTLAKRLPKLCGINYLREKRNYVFDKNMFNSSDYIYYDGYFQNEKYFKHIRAKLVKDFSLKEPLDAENAEVLEQIKATNSVSIHIRRGDYVSLDYVNKIHGVCSLDYYKEAIEYISKRVEKPHFFLFSDDIEWVKANLKIDYPYTVVDFNQKKSHFDLELMKNCKHNIVANSSFSWWGAWLNENPDKTVIAPKNWVTSNQKCDIVPSEWVKL